jgi:pimeloyl-ACP methyl ester carboxylesterase
MEVFAIVLIVIAALIALVLFGVGINAILLSRDRKRIRECIQQGLARKEFFKVQSRGYTLIARWTPPRNPQRALPICIPNGLAATVATIGKMQDAIAEYGYGVLSFDRVGVGFSENEKKPPTVQECVEDMYAVMKAVSKYNNGIDFEKWILLGPSMGSVVAQSFMIRHPELVLGFLNMDRLPHPFYVNRKKFLRAGFVYKIITLLAYTGFMRVALWFSMKSTVKKFATSTFSTDIILSQMNVPEFWSHVAVEMPLMMDLAEDVSHGWGSVAIEKLDPFNCTTLAKAKPAQNGMFDGKNWRTLPRSSAELDRDWASKESVDNVVNTVRQDLHTSALGRLWSHLSVRVMSARQYNYFGGESFYDKEMKRFAAAEHNMHALLARDGARYVFPELGHTNIFLEATCIARCIKEIQDSIQHE